MQKINQLNNKSQHADYQKKVLKKRQIKIQPQSIIVFHSSPYSTVGQIKIFTKHFDRYSFQIKTTNKKGYKVSEAKGNINTSPYHIQIYLKDMQNIQKRLKDTFKLIIHDKETPFQESLQWKFKVMIQQARKDSQGITTSRTNNDNVSKAGSVFTTPSTMTSNQIKNNKISCIRHSNFGKNQRMQKITNIQKIPTVNKEIIKQRFNNSLQTLKQKRGQLDALIHSQKTIKAKNRFRMYIVFILFLFFIFFGYLFGKTFPNLNQNVKSLIWQQQVSKKRFYFF